MHPDGRSSAVPAYPSSPGGPQPLYAYPSSPGGPQPLYAYPSSPSGPQPLSATPVAAVDWHSGRRGRISGRYEGGKASASVVADILDLRIDVDPRYGEESPVMNRVSGDFYTQRLGGTTPIATARRTYVESWIVDEPIVAWYPDRAEITGTLRYWRGNRPVTTMRIIVLWSGGDIQSASVEFRAGETTSIFQCAYKSVDFRSVTMELDYVASVDKPPRMPCV